MKKVLSIILTLSLILCFAACGNSGGLNNKKGDGVAVSLSADKTAVAPGDELVVTVNVKDAEYAACFDLYVVAESDVQFIGTERGEDIGDFFVEGNLQQKDGKDAVYVSGMVATTFDLDDKDIIHITYTVPEDAKIGKSLVFNMECGSFDVGKDESGAEIYSVMEDMALTGISVEIAEESVAADKNAASDNTTAQATTEAATDEASSDEAETLEETTLSEDEETSEDVTEEAVASEEASEEDTTEEVVE